MVQISDKVQHGTPCTKPPDSGRPQTPPKDPLFDELTPEDREGKWGDRKVGLTYYLCNPLHIIICK